MRELTVQEMDLASGGGLIIGILGVAAALAGLATSKGAAATAIGVAGLVLAAYSLHQSQNQSCSQISQR